MIFHRWRKPKEEGRYLVKLDDGNFMILTYIPWKKKWINKERAIVFKGYRVFKHTGTLDPDNRVYEDSLCDLTDRVVKWKRIRRKEKKSDGYSL